MKYVYGKKMKTLKDRMTTGLASLIILANSAGMSLPFLLTQRAAAATATVTPASMGSWTSVTTTGGAVEFVDLPDAQSGSGAAKLTTIDDNDSRARLTTNQFTGTALSGVTEASYWSYVEDASILEGSVSYSIMIDVDGDLSTAADRVSLNHEPYWQDNSPNPAPVIRDMWQQWNVATGKFWANNASLGFMSDPGGPPLYSLSEILGIAPDAVVTDVSVYIGSYNRLYTTYVDLVSFNNQTFDFEPTPAPQITSLAAIKHDASNYKGIYVETKTAGITDAKAISVTIKRADNTTVTKNSKPAPNSSVSGVNNGLVGTPFIIHHGTYDEAGSGSWYPAPASWTYATKPVEVTVVITLGDDTTVEKTVPVSISQAEYQSLVVTPSTNDINKTKGWAHVNEISKNVGSVELEFVSTRNFASCFEYRTDGDISQALATPNLNTDIADRYPAFCLNNETQAHTINANEYVEVRMVYGAEKDERFDWTRFDVLPDTTKPTISINPDVPQFISGTTEIEVTITDDQPLDASKNKQIWVEVYGRYDQTKKKGQKVDLSSGTGIFSLNTTTLPDGEYTLRVGSVADAAGNTSGDKTFKYFTIDNAGPNVFSATINGEDAAVAARTANCGPTDFNLVSGAINLGAIINDGTGVGTEGASYRIVRVNAGGCIMSNPAVNYGGGAYGYKSGNFAMTNTSGDEWTGPEFDTTTLPQDGSYTIEITTRDSLDNEAKRYVDILVDNTAPNAPTNLHRVLADNTIVPCGASIPRQALTPTWTLSSSDDVAHYEYSSFNKNGVPGLVQKNIGNTDHYNTGGWVPPQDGTGFKFAIRAVDHASNKSAWAECGITYDSVAPDAPVLSLHTSPGGDIILDGGLTNSYGVVASWTVGPDDVGYEYRYFNSIPGDAYNAPTYYTTQPTVPTQSGVFNRGEGLHHIQVRAVDAAGNWSDWSEVFDVTYDATAPTQPQILGFYKNNNKTQPIIPCGGFTNSTKILIDWEDGGTDVAYYWFGTKFNQRHAKVTASEYKGNMTPGNNPYYYTVIAVDHAGNESLISDQCSLILDQEVPEAPEHISPADGAYINYNDFWFDWTDVADAVSYETQYSQNPATDTDGAFQTVVWTGDYQNNQPTDSQARSVGASGTWYWQVRAVDAAGNKSVWTAPWELTIDVTPPQLLGITYKESPGDTEKNSGDTTELKDFVFDLVSDSDIARYQLKYWNDIPESPFKQTSPWSLTDLSGYSPSFGSYKDNFTQGFGVHYFSFSACDAAGNCSPFSEPFVITYVDNVDGGDNGNVNDIDDEEGFVESAFTNTPSGGLGQGDGPSNANNVRGVLGDSTGLSNTGSSLGIFAAAAAAMLGAAIWIVRRKSAAN